jgi:hypothetical protein
MKRSGVIFYLCLCAAAAFAQPSATTAEIRGEVTDPSGAAIPRAAVTATGQGIARQATSDEQGRYNLNGLPPGRYVVRVTAEGFTPFEARNVNASAGRTVAVKSKLVIQADVQSITVAEDEAVSVDPAQATAGAIVLKGEDLAVLSDNPDDLASDLQALAGPSAGPNGGEIFIDGFSGGKLPPKSAIREVRVNQNPFSAEYDRLGFGRIEIFTKPGADRFRGQAFFSFGDRYLNSRNPFASVRAPYQTKNFGFNFGGPLSKKSSFNFDVERRAIDENAIVNATILDSSLQPTPFNQAIVTPETRLFVTPRLDYQLSPKNTLVGRYTYSRSESDNQGIGQFNLAQRAYNTTDNDHGAQLTETAVLSAKVINETRFQYHRSNTGQFGNNTIPALNVLDAFTGGGAQTGVGSTLTNSIEIHNITSISHGAHMIKLGGRVRSSWLRDVSPNNFGGTFTFAGGFGPQLDANNLPVAGTSVQLTSLERYRRTLLFQSIGLTPLQIRALGGGASQFTLSGGNPLASVDQTDVGVFVEDSWRLRPQLTVNAGLRYENQTNISSNRNFAPRLSIAWGLDGRNGKPTKTVLRAGFGMFYDRFQQNLTLQALRFNGVTQQQYFVQNPDFYPTIPSLDSLSGFVQSSTRRVVDSNLSAPYIAQYVVGLDRQLPKSTTVSFNFVNSRGVHMLRTRNINAPLPGTSALPYGNVGNVYLYESTGFLNQHQLMVNFNTRFNPRVMLFGFYMMGRAKGDTDNVGTFPANSYNLAQDYGRTSFDVHNRFLIGGMLRPKFYGVSLSPFIMASTGAPFNITTGRDNNGDTIFNDRPSFATNLNSPDVVVTRYGAFNLAPAPGETVIPRNYGHGPAQFNVNLRLAKTWGFGAKSEGSAGASPGPGMGGGGPRMMGGGMGGPGGGGPGGGGGGRMGGGGGGRGGPGGMFDANSDKRFNLTFSVSARNLLNRTNLGTPIGSLSSPLFGESNSLAGGMGGGPGGGGPGGGMGGAAGNRRLELQLRLSF